MTVIQFAAPSTNPTRSGDNGPGDTLKPAGYALPAEAPDSRPVPDPVIAFVELCRVEFTKRFTRDFYGIDIDDCNQVYGD